MVHRMHMLCRGSCVCFPSQHNKKTDRNWVGRADPLKVCSRLPVGQGGGDACARRLP